jgi:hypothetical protein
VIRNLAILSDRFPGHEIDCATFSRRTRSRPLGQGSRSGSHRSDPWCSSSRPPPPGDCWPLSAHSSSTAPEAASTAFTASSTTQADASQSEALAAWLQSRLPSALPSRLAWSDCDTI